MNAARLSADGIDPVGAIEACYRAEPCDETWLQGVVDILRPLDAGRGLAGYCYDARDPERFRVGAAAAVGHPQGWDRAVAEIHRAAEPALIRAIYAYPRPVHVFWRDIRHLTVSPEVRSRLEGFYREMGVGHATGLFGAEPGAQGVVVVVPSAEARRIAPRTTHQLVSVAAHLCSAFRLRQAFAGKSPSPEDSGTDAVLEPSGRVAHATPAAQSARSRAALAVAVARIERARGRARRIDPEAALALWRGLVHGTWSLVDHVESDGKRYVLARRNPPSVRDPKALTERERAVLAYAVMGRSNAFIGYLLGIGSSTVAQHLDVARRKLGVASRRELIAAFST